MTGRKKTRIKVSKAEARQRVGKILPVLAELYPNARTVLKHADPLQLLIATILSAQCTDKRVNQVTSVVFEKYKSAADWANADLAEIENDIRSTGFYRNKAKNIRAACRQILDEHNGKVPDNMNQLTQLAGVGRKTANVILSNVFDKPGITCDTHVIRLSRRLRLSENSDPVKLEFDLAEVVPQDQWSSLSHMLILHGRNICKARKPDCDNCRISSFCPAANNPELW